MMELTLYINGMMCANCSQKLEEKASKLAEIEEIHVNYASAKINVKFKQGSDKNTVFENEKWLHGRRGAFLINTIIPNRPKKYNNLYGNEK